MNKNSKNVYASIYHPFGMVVEKRSKSYQQYRFGFNSLEKDDELSGSGNSLTAQFWQYNSRLAIRFNLDPKPRIGFSPYSCLGNNPLIFIDPNGDTIVIDQKGYIQRQDMENGSLKDNLVYMKNSTGGLEFLGELNNEENFMTVKADEFLDNLLVENAQEAQQISGSSAGLLYPIRLVIFKDLVKQNSRWDYKNRNSSNKIINRRNIGSEQNHILGLAFQMGDHKTLFEFNGKTYTSSDLNNLHFGVVAKAMNIQEDVAHFGAARAEQKKQSNRESNNQPHPRDYRSWKNGFSKGDEPNDYLMIEKGFKYWDVIKREMDK